MLTRLADGLWAAEHDLYLPGRVCFRGRMSVVQLQDGSLLLHSPIPIGDELAAELGRIGPVRQVLAPNLFHHVHLGPVLQRYPDAQLWGAPGLQGKRRSLNFKGTIGDSGAPWAGDLQATFLGGGPSLNETVFFHPGSGTLLCTDLVFNIRRWPNLSTSLMLWMTGTRGRLAMSRSWRLIARDRAALGQSLRKVLGLPFDRLVMGHGDVVESGGHPELERAAGWVLGPPRLAAAQ